MHEERVEVETERTMQHILGRTNFSDERLQALTQVITLLQAGDDALEHLQRLVILRLFELHKLNISQTGKTFSI